MIRLFYFLYSTLLWPAMFVAFHIGSFFSSKLRAGFQQRKPIDGIPPWLAFKSEQRPFWIHCASGEFEYAKPVVLLAKKTWPDIPILVTYFSPSYAESIKRFPGVDMCAPVPWDEESYVSEFLDFHRPRCLLIARTDAWPEMVKQTKIHKIPSLLFSATIAEKSGRARGLGRWAAKAVFAQLTEIYAVSIGDCELIKSILPNAHVQVHGDTRFDQVQSRLKNPRPLKNIFQSTDPVLICGSTWREDEEQIILALRELKTTDLRVIIVPHEPNEMHLQNLEAKLTQEKIQSVRYSRADTWTENQILLVDQIGILADLYAHGDFAFVGGSFRKTVHSVMEPLAAGLVTFIGPQHWNNREAIDFAKRPIPGLPETNCVVVVASGGEMGQRLKSLAPLIGEAHHRLIVTEVEKQTGATLAIIEWMRAHVPETVAHVDRTN